MAHLKGWAVMTRRFCTTIVCLLRFLSAVPAAAQEGATQPAAPQLLRVFIDCQFECDTEYIRQNVQFVDYVRDRTVADVHVLVTTQGTGGGGSAWTVKFIGLGRFDKVDRTLTFNTGPTASDDDRRKEFTRIFKLGVASYAADSSAGPQLDVRWLKPDAAEAAKTATKDPWNFWVFRTNLGGNRDGEESTNSSSYRASFSANRTTEQWKISFSTSGNYNKSEFDLGEDGGLIKSTSHSWSFNSLIVKSLGPKWSVGGRSSVSHSSFSNTDKQFTFAPGVEFSFFPYSESSRRSLTLLYTIGASRYDYKDVTIFDKVKETVPNHSLNTSLGLRQPWGSVGTGITLSQHLNELGRYRISTFAHGDVRLFKGFSFNFFGGYDRIRDQISLRKGGATPEEVLLRRQQLATGHSFNLGFGISYSFGSIFNTVVNPRFGGGGGHFIFF